MLLCDDSKGWLCTFGDLKIIWKTEYMWDINYKLTNFLRRKQRIKLFTGVLLGVLVLVLLV